MRALQVQAWQEQTHALWVLLEDSQPSSSIPDDMLQRIIFTWLKACKLYAALQPLLQHPDIKVQPPAGP